MSAPGHRQARVSEAATQNAQDMLSEALARLAELSALGRFDLALQHFDTSSALQSALRLADRQPIEALLKACATCEHEARHHREALERAVEREQALSRHLLECSERLLQAHVRPRALATPPEGQAAPGSSPKR